MSIVNEVDEVGVTVAVEVVHWFVRQRNADDDIFVKHQRLRTQHGIAATSKIGGFQVMVALYLWVPLFAQSAYIGKLFDFFHSRRRVGVIDVGIVAGKSFGAEEFFGVEGAVRLAKLCMSLRGYLPQAVITWHGLLLLFKADAINRSLHDTVTQYANTFNF